jgi:hypothetical protein
MLTARKGKINTDNKEHMRQVTGYAELRNLLSFIF